MMGAVVERAEIVDGTVSGGATTSQTIVVPSLQAVLAAVPPHAEAGAYERYKTAATMKSDLNVIRQAL